MRQTPEDLLQLVLAAAAAYDRRVRHPEGHRQLIAEVYELAATKLKEQLVYLPGEQVVELLTRQFGLAAGRERYRSRRSRTVSDDAIFNNGTPLSRFRQPTPRAVLDELVHQEDCCRVRYFLECLPEQDRSILLTSIPGASEELNLDQLAAESGLSKRTLERRLEALRARLRRTLEH